MLCGPKGGFVAANANYQADVAQANAAYNALLSAAASQEEQTLAAAASAQQAALAAANPYDVVAATASYNQALASIEGNAINLVNLYKQNYGAQTNAATAAWSTAYRAAFYSSEAPSIALSDAYRILPDKLRAIIIRRSSSTIR